MKKLNRVHPLTKKREQMVDMMIEDMVMMTTVILFGILFIIMCMGVL